MKLTDFYFVGIREFFKNDLNDLKNMLDWPRVKVSVANQNYYNDNQAKVMDILNNKSFHNQNSIKNVSFQELVCRYYDNIIYKVDCLC